MFLKKIVETKRAEVAVLQVQEQTSQKWEVTPSSPQRSLKQSLLQASRKFGIIAEVKPASPSKGVILASVDPITIADEYERGGASAISVLTDRTYFQGSRENLISVRAHVQLPVIRKDFIIDPLQVLESKHMGADAILLIVAILEPEQLQRLSRLAHQLNMEVLVEIHNEAEISAALACEADVIGINNRDLSRFETSLETTERLRPLLPKEQVVIAESGIHSPSDALRMKRAGVSGVLVGEYLMRKQDRTLAVQQLIGANGDD